MNYELMLFFVNNILRFFGDRPGNIQPKIYQNCIEEIVDPK